MSTVEIYHAEKGRRTWSLRWLDHRGISRTVTSKTDNKGTANFIARNIETLTECRARKQSAPLDIAQWLTDGCHPYILERLVEWGIVDADIADAGKPLDKHLLEWKQAILDRERDPNHAETCWRRVAVLLAIAGAEYIPDITSEAVGRALLDMRHHRVAKATLDAIDPPLRPQHRNQLVRGLSAQSCNHYLVSARSFCDWLKGKNRLQNNPLAGVKGYDAKVLETTKTYDRRPLTPEEQDVFLARTKASTRTIFGLTGEDRYLVYLVALYTGLRPKEMTTITRGAFLLEGDDPTLTIAAEVGKAKRKDVLPLHDCLVPLLAEAFANKAPAALAFTLPHRGNIVDMVRADFAAAREGWIEDGRGEERVTREQSDFLLTPGSDGRMLDFYSLRHTFGTNLAREGAPFKLHMELMRHKDVKTTMKFYVSLAITDQRAAIRKLRGPVVVEQKKVG